MHRAHCIQKSLVLYSILKSWRLHYVYFVKKKNNYEYFIRKIWRKKHLPLRYGSFFFFFFANTTSRSYCELHLEAIIAAKNPHQTCTLTVRDDFSNLAKIKNQNPKYVWSYSVEKAYRKHYPVRSLYENGVLLPLTFHMLYMLACLWIYRVSVVEHKPIHMRRTGAYNRN